MAFRIQDPESGLFWKISDNAIGLAETGDEFSENDDGLVNVFKSGSYVYFMDKPAMWKFTSNGSITTDDHVFIAASVPHMRPVISTTPTNWVKVGASAPVPEVAETVPEVAETVPEVAETVPEVEDEDEEEDVPELEDEEEDVPVKRAAALIEEALNAQAAAAAAAAAPEEEP